MTLRKILLIVVVVFGVLQYGFAQESRTINLKVLRAKAELGDAQAQFALAMKYDEGDGVKQDLVEALRWYRRAAEQGLAIAQVRLGAMYNNGEGVPEDPSKAERWWLEAAERGSGLALFNLSTMYFQGRGVPQDYVQAYMWMDLTALRANRTRDKALADLAVRGREALARKMTPAQIAEAQRLAREWKPNNGK